MSLPDVFNLQRFVDAQEPLYEQVRRELSAGRKQSHWMWFVFPQLRGLGHSSMAVRYGISSRAEAEAYLQHPVLGARLRECTQLVNLIQGRSVEAIFGYPDELKFRSCMTLFDRASADDRIFRAALEKYFNGQDDAATLERLGEAGGR